MPSVFAANVGAGPPPFTVRAVVRFAQNSKLEPAPAASLIASALSVPQLAVGAGNAIAILLDVRPLVPVLAVVDPAACVPLQNVSAASRGCDA